MKLNNNELVSVIMSVYNEPKEWINLSLESILNQTYKNIEFIIVIDNPQNIEAIDIIKNISKKDNRVKYILNETNKGIVDSLNIALKLSSGKYIARMDADDISRLDRIECQLDFMVENKKVDMVFSNRRIINEQGKIIKLKDNLPQTDRQIIKLLKNNNFICHPTWMVKREVYIELNGYRNVEACEDYDFILRMLDNGYKISLLDKNLVDYRIRQDGISQSKLFKQFISSLYIKKLYKSKRLDVYEASNLKQFMDKRINCQEDYIASDSYFIKVKTNIIEKKYIIALINFIKCAFNSRYYLLRLKEVIVYKFYTEFIK